MCVCACSIDGEKRTNIIRTEGQLPAHLTVALTVAKSSSAPIMAVIADTSRLWLIVVFSDTARKLLIVTRTVAG